MNYILKLLSIKISYKKGEKRVSIASGYLKKGLGLEGDAYSKPGNKEICIMTRQTIEMLNTYSDGLCIKRFVETLCIDFDSTILKVGDTLEFSDAKVEITSKGKRCFPECKLVKNNKVCPLQSEVIFAKVIRSGEIKV